MRTLDRYLIRETAGPFLFGVLAFVLLFVSANILFKLTQLIAELGISLWTASELFMLWLPGFVVYTLPLATLVAILIAFGRLGGDSELVAMFAGGVSFRRLIVPMIAAGLLVSFATAGLNELVVPAANRRAEEIVRAASQQAGKIVKEDVFRKEMSDNQISLLIYAAKLDVASGELLRPVITFFQQGRPVMVTVAERGRWQEASGSWTFYRGSSTSLLAETPASASFPWSRVDFHTKPDLLARESRSPEEMTYRELKDYLRDALGNRRPSPELEQLEITLYQKLAIPFASLVFALIAPPLGMRSHRGSSSIGLGIAILIGFGYYIMTTYLAQVGRQTTLPAIWAAWLPNLVTAAAGAALVLRVRK